MDFCNFFYSTLIIPNVMRIRGRHPYREEESLSSAGLEEFLPLVCIAHGEGDRVDTVLELGSDSTRPPLQLEREE